MSAPVTLRRARLNDAMAIARVHVETWRLAYPGIVPKDYLVGMTEARQTAQWETSIRRVRGADTILVAEATTGGGLVGFGNCGRARRGGDLGEVFTLYVASDWQGRGIGRALLQGLFAALRHNDLNEVVIWVLSANPARFFYEAMDGTRRAERREPFSGLMLDETAYGWSDLSAWLAARRPAGSRQ